MYDAYSAISSALNLLIARSLSIASSDSVICSLSGYEAASPIALKLSSDVHSIRKRIEDENNRETQLLFGVPLISSIDINGGHICFSLSDEAYICIMRHIIAEATSLPILMANDDACYAYMRMRMLSRCESRGMPDDASVRRALWHCFSLSQSAISARECGSRLRIAVKSVLSIGRDCPPSLRQDLLSRCGDVGRCTSRLLYFAISYIGGK